MKKKIPPYKIGLFGIGLEAYWDQFEGLKERLEGYLSKVEHKVRDKHENVLNVGLVDNNVKAFEAGIKFKQEGVDLILLYVTTYALSSTILPVVQRAKVPVVVLNLAPKQAIDYSTFNSLTNSKEMTGEWLAYCSACPVPEIANVFKRSGILFNEVTGVLEGDDQTWKEIGEWIDAGSVAHTMSYNRLGCMGNYYGGMLDIYTDLVQQYSHFGGHVELLEVDELTSLRQEVSENEIREKLEIFNKSFDIGEGCADAELRKAAITAVALDKLVQKYDLGSMAYYHKGTGNENEETISSIILGTSILTANNIPVAGEYEVKNVQAMKIIDSFGAGGSFTEYYAMDFNDDVVLMGHDGPGHIAIAQGRTRVKPLEVYHGKVGKGLSIEMSVKNGAVTLLSLVEGIDGRLFFLVAEAQSVPGPILEIGNTNSRYKFPIAAREFVNTWNRHGPAHHCAVGIGHIASKIKKLGKLLSMEVVQVC